MFSSTDTMLNYKSYLCKKNLLEAKFTELLFTSGGHFSCGAQRTSISFLKCAFL